MKQIVSGILTLVLALAMTAVAGEKTQSFPAKKGGALEVRVAGGSVFIKGWEKDEVFVRAQSMNDDQLKKVEITQGGGQVLVEFRWEGRGIEDMRFDIQVPSSFDVDLRTGGGELSIESPLSGVLKGSTAGGDIHLGNVGGTIRMETAGGDIKGGTITGDVSVRTAGGEIALENVSGTVEVSTAGGDIKIGSVSKTLRASTAGGDIAIGKVSGDVSASSAGGSIKLQAGQGAVSLNTAGGSIAVESARGKVNVNTSAGDVDLRGIEGSVNARSAAGNLHVALDPAVGEMSTLATSAGNIVLSIPGKARVTVYARVGGPHVGHGGKDEEHLIRSDFPITYEEGSTGHVELNGGGHKITLETMIGRIEITKGK
jgi:DUF4097 and DUF4098 domain-containing protein YvlB